MGAARRIAAIGVSAALLAGALAMPVVAEQSSRSGDPEITSLAVTAEETLRAAVRAARAAYTTEITAARAQRATGLAAPKSDLAAALKKAKTKPERRLARRAYDRSAAPVIREYRTAKAAAQAKRNATIDEALANYLVATEKPTIAVALKAYRAATALAGDTLELALKSGRDTLKTDTADERAQLVTDLEEATTEKERLDAWLDFQAASTGDRVAYAKSIASARATYSSAMVEARRAFKLATGLSIKTLLKLPFKV
ncbi:MAG TPA: hypothetical protein VES03_03895 [Motilibacterales bacterium]|nr:hypothetical protein [Motilibacterales bacterium]